MRDELRALECRRPGLRRLRRKTQLRRVRRVAVAAAFLLLGWYGATKVRAEYTSESYARDTAGHATYSMLGLVFTDARFRPRSA